MILNELCRTEAQRGLIRVLCALVSSEERCREVVMEALKSDGNRVSLPADPVELVAFARAHLAGPLAREIGEILARGCLDALDLEIEKAKTRPPPPPSKSIPPQQDVVPNRMKEALIVGGARSGDRATVLLVHADCVVRATIARAFVIGGFDVATFEAMSEVSISTTKVDTRTIAIVDLDDAKDEVGLKNIVSAAGARARLGVVARTDQSDAAAHGALATAGVNRAIVVRRNASDVELVEAARKIDRGLRASS